MCGQLGDKLTVRQSTGRQTNRATTNLEAKQVTDNLVQCTLYNAWHYVTSTAAFGFKPAPTTYEVVTGCYMSSICFACLCPCFYPRMCPCFRDYMFPQYLQYLLMDFCQTFVIGASCDEDELFRFWGPKVKDQGHIITAEASDT